MASLVRRLGAADLTLIVIGGCIGSGIFRLPALVAQRAQSPGIIILVWVLGGLITLSGAGVFAELAARRPVAGGWYTYLREAFHPLVAFELGWALLTLIASGAMAAAAILFADYFNRLTSYHIPAALLAVVAVAAITFINCVGVRQGCNVQNTLTILKLLGVVTILIAGFGAHPVQDWLELSVPEGAHAGTLTSIATALIPVMFAYFGWVYVTMICAEVRDPARSMAFGLLFGLAIVTIMYVLVNMACIRVLGVGGLASTATPVADVLYKSAGSFGAKIVTIAVVLSTLGFISNRMLTAPRATHAMALNGDVFPFVGWIHPRTRVPVIAIALQGLCTMALSVSGTYEQVVSRGTVASLIFLGLGAIALFVVRERDRASARPSPAFRVPLQPYITALFAIVCAALVVETTLTDPVDSVVCFAVLAAGVPVYFLFERRRKVSVDRSDVAVEA